MLPSVEDFDAGQDIADQCAEHRFVLREVIGGKGDGQPFRGSIVLKPTDRIGGVEQAVCMVLDRDGHIALLSNFQVRLHFFGPLPKCFFELIPG